MISVPDLVLIDVLYQLFAIELQEFWLSLEFSPRRPVKKRQPFSKTINKLKGQSSFDCHFFPKLEMLKHKQTTGLDLFGMDLVEKGAEKEKNSLSGYCISSLHDTNIYQF